MPMKMKQKTPRKVFVRVTDEIVREALYLIRGLGKVVSMVPPDLQALSPWWTITIENPSWPDGPNDVEANIQITESRDPQTMAVKAEILLPR